MTRSPCPPSVEEGVRAFNQGRHHAAHEIFEQLWRTASGERRALLQGLIQVAGACFHVGHHRHRQAVILLRRARARMNGLRGEMEGIDVDRVRGDMDRWLDLLDRGEVTAATACFTIRAAH